MSEVEPWPPPPLEEEILTVTQRTAEGVVVVAATGEVDAMTAPRLAAALGRALRSPLAPRVVVDLTGVTFLASAGLEVLIRADEQQARGGCERPRLVVGERGPALRSIQVMGLDRVLMLCGSMADALAA